MVFELERLEKTQTTGVETIRSLSDWSTSCFALRYKLYENMYRWVQSACGLTQCIQVPVISVTIEAIFTPEDEEGGLAAVGEIVKLSVWANNAGNVDINDVELSEDGERKLIRFSSSTIE